MTTTNQSQQQQQSEDTHYHHHKVIHVVFIHLDLGIGGAEQLILQLANASQQAGHVLDIVTTRCDPHHCFASVKPDGGNLYSSLHIWGSWIPHDICGIGRAACSTLRLLYLAYRVARKHSPNVIVLDVLPTPLPLLQLSEAGLLFYCHFPDQLLTRRPNPGSITRLYRKFLDWMEASTMLCADICVVNSQFTRTTVQSTFPSLQQQTLPVLYPALDTTSLDQVDTQQVFKQNMIVSLNRYERKKNLELLIEAAAWLRTQSIELPHIVIAGGYDKLNVENVQYRAELQQLADQYQIPVDFRQSISDAERATLLHTALAVVYTPTKEHFGIVPLEAMYAGTPVVAVNSGGPQETVLHKRTGYLCDPTPASFGAALQLLIQDPEKAAAMGQAGRKHVQETFGEERLLKEWKYLVRETVKAGQQRRARPYRLTRSALYVMEALISLLVCMLLTWMLRQLNVLEPSESIWGKLRKVIHHDEL